jgi:hypothetical protein
MRIEPERNKSKYFTTRLLHRWYDYVEKISYINVMLFTEKSRFFIFQLQFLLFLLLFYHKQMEEDNELLELLYDFTTNPEPFQNDVHPPIVTTDENEYDRFRPFKYCHELKYRVFRCPFDNCPTQVSSEDGSNERQMCHSITEHQRKHKHHIQKKQLKFDIKKFTKPNINIKLKIFGNRKNVGKIISKDDGDYIHVPDHYVIIEEWRTDEGVKKIGLREPSGTVVVPSKKQKPSTPPAYNPIFTTVEKTVKVTLGRFWHGTDVGKLFLLHEDCNIIQMDIYINDIWISKWFRDIGPDILLNLHKMEILDYFRIIVNTPAFQLHHCIMEDNNLVTHPDHKYPEVIYKKICYSFFFRKI